MARKKKELQEISANEIAMEEVSEINIEELPAFPEIPLPEEPVSEIEKDVIIEELERKNNDLIQQLYHKERELEELRMVLDNQTQNFERTIAKFVYDVYGR